MPTVKLSPVFNGQSVTSAGVPASGYKVYTYAAGSSTLQSTYTDSSGSTAQSNPVLLNANGSPANPIWLQSGLSYKMVLKDASDVVVRTIDNVSGVNDTTANVSQWVGSSATPTYVSATSFTLSGDQTTEFHVGRRVQCTVTAGTVYGTITASAYTTLTTVTVTMDSGMALDSGLSVVNLSILRADRPAIPYFSTAGYGVRSLFGAPNGSTPTTKFDLSADVVTLRNSFGSVVTRFATGTITCDFGLAGSAANGRDQSAAFTASSWIHLYFIWNGTTLATLASTTVPASFTGSTLPTGYTHWCYAASVYWNASSNILYTVVRGAEAAPRAQQTVLGSGTSTSEASVSLAAFIPPNALSMKADVFVNNSAAATANAKLRLFSGFDFDTINVAASPAGYMHRDMTIPNVSQNLFYAVSASTCALSIYPTSYRVANGDA